MTTIAHVSDTHGYLNDIAGDFDVIVHSGDFLPNLTRGIRSIETAYQKRWVEDNAAALHRWVRHRPLLLTHGNHDFIDAVPVLQSIGVEAYGLDDHKFEFQGVTYYGFPHVPQFCSEWNYECPPAELEARVNAIDLEGVDVLVAHCPIYGVLDRNSDGERCGSKPMRKFLQDSPYTPKLYLNGHIHEQGGRMMFWSRGIRVSNAAMTQQLIHL